jgi:hypothetical protein
MSQLCYTGRAESRRAVGGVETKNRHQAMLGNDLCFRRTVARLLTLGERHWASDTGRQLRKLGDTQPSAAGAPMRGIDSMALSIRP